MQPRIKTDIAIDCAIHNLPDPKNGWRDLVPPLDLGSMVSSGSGQIGLQGLVALLHYDKNKAIPTLLNYYQMCKGGRFMLSEPWSGIYGFAIVSCWLAVVIIAERQGLPDLASKYRELLSTWAGTCALMESNGLVMAAGCRSWGADYKRIGFHHMWAVASGKENPKGKGKPGVDDDWGWRDRCLAIGVSIIRQEASKWLNKSPEWLIENVTKWGARTEMCLYGWSDGSRLWTMGDDEVELDDEDQNSNTPGILLAGVLGHHTITLPRWPCKTWTGRDEVAVDHLRQTQVFADLDGNWNSGWTLYHSHLGDAHNTSTGYMLSMVLSYRPQDLIFAIRIPGDEAGFDYPVWHNMLHNSNTGAPQFPAPTGPVKPVGDKPLNAIQRLLRKLGLY